MHDLTKKIQNMDASHHIHPFSDSKLLNKNGAKVITKADGVWLWDSDGNKILDGMAGLWCVNIGYGHTTFGDVLKKQVEELPYYNLFFQTTHPKIAELSQVLDALTPEHMHHVFFCSSGSEANDTVVRMVRHYWASKGQAEKSIVISRHNAYHGSTMAAASLGGMKPMHAQGGLPIPGIVHINQPYWYGEGGDMSPEDFGLKVARELEEKILELGEEKVAAFIAEPIQGAGGVIVPPSTYWPEVKRILDKYDILFVCDEVICGFGRLGEWFGAQSYELKPDLMAIAKGLTSGYVPMGGVVISEKVADVLINQGGEFTHGYTYSGHPLSAVAALENIRIFKEYNYVDKVREETGPYLQKRFEELNEYPHVGETRGKGMLAAIEICKDKDTRTPFHSDHNIGKMGVRICIQHNLVMRAIKNSMVVSPPLCITKEEIDQMMDKIHAVLKQLGEEIKGLD